MENRILLQDKVSLQYGTIEEDEIFPGIEREISEQELEAKRNILMNLICTTINYLFGIKTKIKL